MGQGTETCADRPTEVSVIRFVSRNRTIEEIAPKKEVYTCKQRGCGKIFTNQDEYKTHEALEALKIRFVCREPGCGEELSDPGSMWRHYQEWHSNETNVFSCPYTGCGSLHTTSNNLEEHIETCHRQPPNLPTEPEIICFEGSENVIDEDGAQNSEDSYYESERENRQQRNDVTATRSDDFTMKNNDFILKRDEYASEDDGPKKIDVKTCQNESYTQDRKKICVSPKLDEYLRNNDMSNKVSIKFSKSEELFVTKENFFVKYEARTSNCSNPLQIDNSQDKSNVVFINDEVTITKNVKTESSNTTAQSQEHRIDLGNLERVFRSGFERDSPKIDDSAIESNSNCSDDEEYTPKKQRMSRYKQDSFKCDVNGCGKMYKHISHYRHHQDSHRLVTNSMNANLIKSSKPKQEKKASTVSFFVCKMPGCGAEVNNVTGLWKHYQDNHANSKLPIVQTTKSTEIFRCKVPGCEMEFNTTLMLYKHFNEMHTNGSADNVSTNAKTGNGSSLHFTNPMFHDDATAQQANFKTDFKANHKTNMNDYDESDDDQTLSLTVKEESRD